MSDQAFPVNMGTPTPVIATFPSSVTLAKIE